MDIACVAYIIILNGMYGCSTTENTVLKYLNTMGARNPVGIGLSYRPSRLHMLAELIPWNRFFGSLKVQKPKVAERLQKPKPYGPKGL